MGDIDERRQARRIQISLKFISCSSGLNADSRITNLSSSGAFIASTHLLPVDTEVALHLQLPGDSEIMPIDARVVWNKSVCSAASAGMGIEFTHIAPAHQNKLAAFIEQSLRPDSSQEQATVYV
jgi:uncharacterized protein (TIGR02266 family)